jgi:hypothetical protein
MSIEVSVLSDRRLASTAEWQRAIDAEGFPLQLDPEVAIESASGFFPARFGDKITGFECYHDDAGEMMDEYPDVDFGRRWAYALSLRIMGDFDELRASYMAATAYARATDGVVFDTEGGEVMSPDKAAEVTRDIERNVPEA